jgi:hypothetical protein
MRGSAFVAIGLPGAVVSVVVACGAPQQTSGTPTAPLPSGAPLPAADAGTGGVFASCPTSVDVADLLQRHGRAYGDPAAVAADLPRSFTADITQGTAKGHYEAFADDRHYANVADLGPLHMAGGVDDGGSWEVDGLGSLVRHRPDESNDLAFEAWLLRRAYVGASYDVTCESDPSRDGRPLVHARLKSPALGDPQLDFDLATAELLSASYTQTDGERLTRTYEGWSAPDARGVRWPAALTDRGEIGEPVHATITSMSAGVHCSAGQGDVCFAARTPRMVVTWPKAARVRVPMDFSLSELALRARVGDHDVWALLDSGAGITTLEGGSAGALGFVSSLENEGMGATQKVKFGFGELPSITIGDLSIAHVPTASVPIPALGDFGDKAPSIILGYPLFEQMAVRIDYAKSEIVFARDADGLAAPAATGVPFRSLSGKPVADTQIDGASAPFELDTGNSGAFDMNKWWADAHGFPGARPALDLRGRFGAGSGTTTSTFLRVGEARLGAIVSKTPLVQIVDPGEHSIIAGLVGERAFARCAAVVFDFAKRTLWLEPPCDRPPMEDRGGFRLTRKDAPDAKSTPWVVGAVLPGGAAATAGIRDGDRLLEVAGKPATGDVGRIVVACRQPAGTRVPVVVSRDGKRLSFTVTLSDLLGAPAAPGP